MLHFLFFFGIFSYLHGPIRTYTFIYFRKKFPPTRLLGTRRLFIFEAKSQLSTWDPCISWFQNSWLSLFFYSVSGTNFLNFQPFHDFQKKNSKFFLTFTRNWYTFLLMYEYFGYWEWCQSSSVFPIFTQQERPPFVCHYLQPKERLIYCLNLMNQFSWSLVNYFFYFTQQERPPFVWQYLQPKERLIYCLNLMNQFSWSLVNYFFYFTQRERSFFK